MKRELVILFILVLGFISCDEIDDPIPKDVGQDIEYNDVTYVVDPALNIGNLNGLLDLIDNNSWTEVNGGDNSTERFIVLEEFTGHQCIFCPNGTKELLRLDSIYGEQLIPVSIHAGSFAEPSTGKYETDYRVLPHCNIYQSEFNVATFGYPAGLVSRRNAQLENKDNWGIVIADLADDVPQAELKLKNYYSQDLNVVRVNLGITFNQVPTETFNLQLYITEDHIRDWQKDFAQGDIENYDHRHMLRKVVNGTYGRSLENITAGEEINIEYILPLEANWKPDDVESVAFIFDSDPSSYNIIQGNSAHVK
ncbi:MAG: hypothetical protein CMP59_12680 [Flavobacteriales bacterium]|nr:hypothetical protein [Flavobacteriales bacterium]|tara:strand:- start:534 stop:1460 length:927 start_codon:yes stop_codon:yes gene_type:complete